MKEKSEYQRMREAEIFEENGLLGLREADGNILYPPKCKQIEICRDFIWFLKPNKEYFIYQPGCSETGNYKKGMKVPNIVNGKFGLKGKKGKILFKPVFDYLLEWPNADVIYTETGDEYHYYNHAGEEILTEVRPLDNLNHKKEPYYIQEYQATGQLVVREVIDQPKGNRCCFINGHWEQLDRIALSEVKFIMGGGELIRMPDHAFDELENWSSYLYSAYIARATGPNCVRKCLDQFIKMGCYSSSWSYITKVWINPNSTLAYNVIADIWNIFSYIEIDNSIFKRSLGDSDLKRISIGFDPELKKDEVKMMQVLYFSDRFPDDTIERWLESVYSGGSDEDVKMAYKNLIKYFEKDFYDFKDVNYLRDSLMSKPLPCNYDSPNTWENEEQKYEFLLALGLSIDTVLADMLGIMHRHEKPFGLKKMEFIEKKVIWLINHDTDINSLYNCQTPLDHIVSLEMKVTKQAESVFGSIKRMIVEAGGKRSTSVSMGSGDLKMLEYKKNDINYQKFNELFNLK